MRQQSAEPDVGSEEPCGECEANCPVAHSGLRLEVPEEVAFGIAFGAATLITIAPPVLRWNGAMKMPASIALRRISMRMLVCVALPV